MTGLAGWLARHAPGERPWPVRAVALLVGVTLFGAVFPWLLVALARSITAWLHCAAAGGASRLLAALLVVAGLGVMLAAVGTQVIRGRGTPVPVVPTQTLLTTGIYALCRNPMKLGFIAYASGLALALSSPPGALAVVLLLAAIGTAYHRRVEEHELAQRFGQPYLDYQATTPFVLPTAQSLRRALGRPPSP